MQYELGYKVITKDGRHSAIFGAYDHNSVVYNPLEEACPAEGCGPLALFCYPSYANRWKLDICMPEKLIIVKCIYIPSKKKKLWARNGNSQTLLPLGTILADVVICLE